MCAYDTTLADTLQSNSQVPECLRRNLLDSPYFPRTSRGALAAIVVLCLVFFAVSLNRLNHTDLWGHLTFGCWIVEHAALPAADPIAADPAAQSFLNVPWLAQVAGYGVYRLAGPEGLVFAHALLATLACGMCILAIQRRGVGLGMAALGGIVVFVLSLPVVGTIRPQLFGMAGVALTLLACSQLPTKRHPCFWLPATFALWANLHGSFVIGAAILGCCSLGAAWSAYREHQSLAEVLRAGTVRRMWLALAAAIAGACLNPIGPLLLLEVASFGSTDALAQISEWRTLEFRSLTGMLFYGSLAVTVVLARYSTRRIELHEVLLLLLMAAATLSAIRMLTWWALIWPWVVAPHAASAWSRIRRDEQVETARRDSAAPMRTVIAMGFVFMTLLVAPPSHSLISGESRGLGQITSSDTPLYVADEIQRRELSGRFFAPMDWADYLAFSGRGRLQPLAYSHVHLLAPETWSDYTRLALGESDWLEIARRQRLDYLVVSKQRHGPLKVAVWSASRGQNPPARIVYQDQMCMLVQLLPEVALAQ